MEEVPSSGGKEIPFAMLITLGIVVLGGFGLYYFLAPPGVFCYTKGRDTGE